MSTVYPPRKKIGSDQTIYLTSDSPKIIQIIPYFGKWPEYFDLYLYSCSRNPVVKFLFYTDCPIPSKKYPNVEFRHISFIEYCNFASRKLGIKFMPLNAYKLCDLRPFYGFIHAEDISEFDFWGFGDIDLIYGDLSRILNKSNLKKYDLITTQDYHIAGHFTILRNNDSYRNVCFRIPDWEKKLLMPNCIAMDELDLSHILFPSLRYVVGFYDKILKRYWPKCFHPLIKSYSAIFKPHMLFSMEYTSPEPKSNEHWLYDLKSGEILDPYNRNLPYLHFLFFKSHPDKSRQCWNSGYYHLKEEIDSYRMIDFSLKGIRGME